MEEKNISNKFLNDKHDLIVVIVKKYFSEEIMESAKKVGAEGGTIIFGRGIGVHEKSTILGIPVEPEKEIIFIIVDRGKTEKVIDSIKNSADLNQPGMGVGFLIELNKVWGIHH